MFADTNNLPLCYTQISYAASLQKILISHHMHRIYQSDEHSIPKVEMKFAAALKSVRVERMAGLVSDISDFGAFL